MDRIVTRFLKGAIYTCFALKAIVLLVWAAYLGQQVGAFNSNLALLRAPHEKKIALSEKVGLKGGLRVTFESCAFQRGQHVIVELAGSSYFDHIFYVHDDCRIDYLKYPGGARTSGAFMWRDA